MFSKAGSCNVPASRAGGSRVPTSFPAHVIIPLPGSGHLVTAEPFRVSAWQIFGQANTAVKRWLLDFASKRKEAELRSGVIRNNSLWDKLIFRKIQVTR